MISKRAKEKHQKAIRNVIKGLSRKVEVYMQFRRAECFNCTYDKFTDSSTGKCKYTAVQAIVKQQEWEDAGNTTVRYKYFLKGRCPICSGRGYLETVRKTWIDALVIWDPSARGYGNSITYGPAGTEGSTVLQLKTNPKHFDLFKNSTKIVVDGIECKMSKPPLLRGLGVQAILLVTAFTTEKQSIDSDEIIKDYT
jgi:hypothetical protein